MSNSVVLIDLYDIFGQHRYLGATAVVSNIDVAHAWVKHHWPDAKLLPGQLGFPTYTTKTPTGEDDLQLVLITRELVTSV